MGPDSRLPLPSPRPWREPGPRTPRAPPCRRRARRSGCAGSPGAARHRPASRASGRWYCAGPASARPCTRSRTRCAGFCRPRPARGRAAATTRGRGSAVGRTRSPQRARNPRSPLSDTPTRGREARPTGQGMLTWTSVLVQVRALGWEPLARDSDRGMKLWPALVAGLRLSGGRVPPVTQDVSAPSSHV